MKKFPFLVVIFAALASITFTSAYSQADKNVVVLVQYKTQPGKDSVALSTLKDLINKVKLEPYYVNIVLHVDPVDRSNILLYEEWSDEVYYNGEHMKTAHLKEFINNAGGFLAGPPSISFWTVSK